MSEQAVLLKTETSPFARCLGVDGLSVHSLHHQIVTVIERELGSRHARLFAKPLEGQDARDWYAACPGPCTPASELSEEDRRQLFEETESLWLAIAELAKSTSLLNERQRKAIALIRPPLAAGWLYRCNGQPVSIGWGLEIADDPLPKPGDILRIKLPTEGEAADGERNARPQPPAAGTSPIEPDLADAAGSRGYGRFWPGLLLLIPLLALILWWLCRTGSLPLGPCVPQTPQAIDPIVPFDEKPLDVMAGRWKISDKTPLRDTQTNVRLFIEYSFDQSGVGTRHIRQEDGIECRGPSHIKWADEQRIRVYSDKALCNRGNKHYTPEEILCKPSAINKPAECVQRDTNEDDKITLVPILDK